ncbi:hypothetical protein N9O21_03300 [Rhodobacteraceae bacterium]|nr:hypothetical protein [Paracoccaceae bacterium]
MSAENWLGFGVLLLAAVGTIIKISEWRGAIKKLKDDAETKAQMYQILDRKNKELEKQFDRKNKELEEQIQEKNRKIKNMNFSTNKRYEEIFAYQKMEAAIVEEYKQKGKVDASSKTKLRRLAKNYIGMDLEWAEKPHLKKPQTVRVET